MLGLGPIKDLAGNVIREAPLQIWANFRARALEVAVTEINKKTDLKISIESLEQADYRRILGVTFGIKA